MPSKSAIFFRHGEAVCQDACAMGTTESFPDAPTGRRSCAEPRRSHSSMYTLVPRIICRCNSNAERGDRTAHCVVDLETETLFRTDEYRYVIRASWCPQVIKLLYVYHSREEKILRILKYRLVSARWKRRVSYISIGKRGETLSMRT